MKKNYQYSKSSKVEVTLSQEFCAQPSYYAVWEWRQVWSQASQHRLLIPVLRRLKQKDSDSEISQS